MIQYCKFTQDGKTALVRDECSQTVADALLDGIGCTPAERGGRGAVRRFPCDSGHGIIRSYRRGGMVRFLMRGGYLLRNRPHYELRLHTHVYEQGLSVPEPLGALWERRGLLFRGAFATREIDGTDLLTLLSTGPENPGTLLLRVGELIRDMHDIGVYHADLHAGNILIAGDTLYLLDFDNARLFRSVSRLARARNLLRMRRALEKHFLPARFFDAICEGYGVDSLPRWLTLLYSARGLLSDTVAGRRNSDDGIAAP
jgi:3-deoxy-D-manno-octulosonic acid kinase